MSKTKTDDKNKLESKLKTATSSDNGIIDELVTKMEKAIVLEKNTVDEIKQSYDNFANPKPNAITPYDDRIREYHKRGRTVNQLAGMFMVTEAKIKEVISENV
jgi:hypothetical protein